MKRQTGTSTAAAKDSLPRPYWLLWTSSTASNLGDGVRLIAIPLLAASVTSAPITIAGLSAVSYAPWIFLALIAGGVADRVRRKALMIRLQLLRAVVVAGFAILMTMSDVGIAWIFALAVVLGVVEVFYDTTAQTALPALLPPQQLERGNARLMAGEMTTNEFIGPPLGGWLFAVRSSVPFFFDACTFLVSAVLLRRIGTSLDPTPEERPDTKQRQSFWASIADGVRFAVASAFLRSWIVMVAVLNLTRAMTVAIFVLYVLEVLHGNNALFGFLSTMAAVGSVAGSWLAVRSVARFGRRTTVILGLCLHGGSNLLLGAVPTIGTAVVAGVAFGTSIALMQVVRVAVQQALVPATHRGRVGSVMRFVSWGVLPLGAMAGGVLAQTAGLRTPYLLGGGIVLLVGAVLLRSLTTIPSHIERLLDGEPDNDNEPAQGGATHVPE